MTDIYKAWVDLGIDGFRIDTVKHVNMEFWQKFAPAILDHAKTGPGNDEFFMFGEVYDANPAFMSTYTTAGNAPGDARLRLPVRRAAVRPRQSQQCSPRPVRRRRLLHRRRLQRLRAAHLPRQPRHGPAVALLDQGGLHRRRAAAAAHPRQPADVPRPRPAGDVLRRRAGLHRFRRRQGRPPGHVCHPDPEVHRRGQPVRRGLQGALRHRYARSTTTIKQMSALRLRTRRSRTAPRSSGTPRPRRASSPSAGSTRGARTSTSSR